MADIIFDVDGTLMNIEHRRHHVAIEVDDYGFRVEKKRDWKAFRKAMADDTPNEDIVMMAKLLKEAGHRIIIATGRLQSERAVTLKQLLGAGVVFDAIYTRENVHEFKSDSEVKEKFLDRMKADGYNPTMAFDDRQKVVDMWRRNGLRVFQVDKGDF